MAPSPASLGEPIRAIADLSGRRLAYTLHGADLPAVPAVLVMGFSMPGRAWRFIVPELATERPVLTFDNRGAGESDAPRGPYRMGDLATDALDLATHVGFQRFHLVGVSMGGMIAQEMALSARTRLPSLTLIATHPGGLTARIPPLRGLWHFLRANMTKIPEKRFRALSNLLFPRDFRESMPEEKLHQLLAQDFEPRPPKEGRKGQLAAVLGHDTRRRLASLAGLPTLIVKPEHDLLISPRNSDLLHELIPGSSLMKFADAGHGLIRQKGPELGEALRTHFARAET
jgi:pimeloyl-ACP methyl ester carboxylesterase